MQDNHLHIISFDIPFPPNYGGVIDVFYKIKALHRLGVKIHLHCIEYMGREPSEELQKYTEKVYYYPRKTGFKSALSFKPYIVSSRRSEEMIANLLRDDHPIIFEGLHSCYYINDPRLRHRVKIYRESNIEHRYYFNLFKVERQLKSKLYFLAASMKLRAYQKVLRHADLLLAVSEQDTEYLRRHFSDKKVILLPSFHANDEVAALDGKGYYALYHGNIEVPENEYAATFLIRQVFNNLEYPLVVAGMKPRASFRKLVSANPKIRLIANPDDEEMFDLIRNAHVNVLVTFQATGLKLKLLNTLYNGRFCLVNQPMVTGTRLGSACEIGNDAGELKRKLHELFNRDFTLEEAEKRTAILNEHYNNAANGQELLELIYGKATIRPSSHLSVREGNS
jgi:hypothetical protein